MSSLDVYIEEAFDALQESLQALSGILLTEKPPCWLPGAPPDPHTHLCALYNDIWYIDGSDGRTTRSQCGLIGGTPRLIQAAQQVNLAKTAFKQAVSTYRQSHGRYPDDALHNRAKALSEKLKRQGLARLHLKQCYRQIPVLSFTPKKVGFNWYCSGRSIKRITVEDATQTLLKSGAEQPHVQVQLKILASLPQAEPLAQLQTQAPVIRANLQWLQNDKRQRRALNSSLPIIFPLPEGDSFPEHNEIPLHPPAARSRQERSDIRIDPIPLLPGLRIHRYKA